MEKLIKKTCIKMQVYIFSSWILDIILSKVFLLIVERKIFVFSPFFIMTFLNSKEFLSDLFIK